MKFNLLLPILFAIFISAILNAKDTQYPDVQRKFTAEIWQFDSLCPVFISELPNAKQARKKGTILLRENIEPNVDTSFDAKISYSKFDSIHFEIIFTPSKKYADMLFSQIKFERKSFEGISEILNNNKNGSVYDFHIKIGKFLPLASVYSSSFDFHKKSLEQNALTYAIRIVENAEQSTAPISMHYTAKALNPDGEFQEMIFKTKKSGKDFDEKIFIKKEPFISPENVIGAQILKGDTDSHKVAVQINSKGRNKLREASELAVAEKKDNEFLKVAIVVNGKIKSVPAIISKIDCNYFIVLADSQEDAQNLADAINNSVE